MRVGVLFSGGKDSVYSTFLAKKRGDKIVCLINMNSKNKYSYMFHTPSVSNVDVLAESMEIPLLKYNTAGIKENELVDLEHAILDAKKKFKIECVVTGAIKSAYQSSRIEKICNKLGLELYNPLWKRDEFDLLNELIKNKFDVRIVGVFAYPLEKNFLGKKIDNDFVKEVKVLNSKYKISPIGEGGEFESFVVGCPMYKKKVVIESFKDFCDGENSCRRELRLKLKDE